MGTSDRSDNQAPAQRKSRRPSEVGSNPIHVEMPPAGADPRSGDGAVPPGEALTEALLRERARAESAEQELRSLKERFAALQASSGQWMWATNTTDAVEGEQIGGDARTPTGQYAADVWGLDWIATVHPDDRLRVSSAWQQAVATETYYEDVLRAQGADGSYRRLIVRGVPVREADGHVREWVGTTTDITEHNRSEQAAAVRARQLEVIFEAVADGVVIYDETGSLLEWNAALSALFEFDRMPDYAGQAVDERPLRLQVRDEQDRPIPVDQLPFVRALHGEVLTGSRAVDLTVTTPSGQIKNVNASSAAIHDESGRVNGAVTVYRDVTERRDLERQARWQASMLERAHDAMFMWELGGAIMYWNRGAEQAYGYAKDEALGRVSHELLRTQHPGMREEFETALARDGEWTGELIHTTRDGSQVVVLSRHQVIVEPDGRSYVLETSHDITERKRLEVRTHDALEALLAMAEALVKPPESNSANQQTLAAVADMSLDGDPSHGRRSAIAQRLAALTCQVLGCTRVGITVIAPETRQMHAVAVVGLPPEQERRWWAEQEALERQGMRLGEGADADQLAQIARFEAGEVFVIDMTLPPYDALPNPYGITTSLVAPMRVDSSLVGMVSLDYGGPSHEFTAEEQALAGAVAKLAALVVERERLLQEGAAARARALVAEEAQQRQDDFLHLVTHELRSPLTSLKLNLQSARRRAERLGVGPSAEARPNLSTLIERSELQVERLARMVDDLMDTARIQAGKLSVEQEPYTFDAFVALARERVEEQRQAHPTRILQLQTPEVNATSSPILSLDAGRIGQVLTNFLTNALKYSPEDKPIVVSVRNEGTRVWIAVRDEGPGLPPEEQAHIWERFHQAEGVEAIGGMGVGLGLGLFISRSLIDRHGGELGVQSAVGKGSTFWFALPMSARDAG